MVSTRARHLAEVRGCLVISHAHHLAEVKGWWSAILTVSSCGARQPCASSHHLVEVRRCVVISHAHHLAEVRGWWSAMHVILLWSRVGGQLLTLSTCGPGTSSCRGQGLVVSHAHDLAEVRGWWSRPRTSSC